MLQERPLLADAQEIADAIRAYEADIAQTFQKKVNEKEQALREILARKKKL
ncbi:MAG: hypothetical protein LH618_02840 [Saprospiraceae bacterium]|nr:hypothetical protein [Saprospiraceae bacterium]